MPWYTREQLFERAQHGLRSSISGSSSGKEKASPAGSQRNNSDTAEGTVHRLPARERAWQWIKELNVEKRGIERVPDDEKTDYTASNAGTPFISSNLAVCTLPVGALASPVFGLGFVDSALVIVIVNAVGILPVCFFATFGPRFGLRQVVLSRFFFGYYGAKLVALLNIFSLVGWSAANSIVGAQLLHAVNPGMPGWAGVAVFGAVTLVICVFGYRALHAYERFAWIPCLAVFIVIAVELGRSGDFRSLLPLSSSRAAASGSAGAGEAGAVLSFTASVYGYATSFCTLAADYTVYRPASSPRPAIFAWAFLGLYIPTVFVELLGAAIATAVVSADADPAYQAAYRENHVGGLLARLLLPPLGRGFGSLCMVVLALSIVASVCLNTYSMSLSLQVLARGTARVPRPAWALVGTAAFVAVAVPGYDHFVETLETFMLLIGYWLAIYEPIALVEHFVFRSGALDRWLPGVVVVGDHQHDTSSSSSSSSSDGEEEGQGQERSNRRRRRRYYRPEDYDKPDRLPPGYAAAGALALGVLGAVLGMAQPYFVGPVGALCGAPGVGGDVGFELAFVFTAVGYVVLRALERGKMGR